MRNLGGWIVFLLAWCACGLTFAADLRNSARTDIWEDPFLAYGYNPKTKVITGYLEAFRTAPGRTDACKLVFRGNADRLTVKYRERTWVPGSDSKFGSGVSIKRERGELFLKFSKESLGGDCDWIIPFNVGQRVIDTADEVSVTMTAPRVGNWIGVFAISAKLAKFHSRPDSASVRNAHLVEGDVIYVYEERPDWYFVQFEEGKRKTVGWIKKSDTVQP